MKSFKIVGIIIGVTISALIYFNNSNTSKNALIEDEVGVKSAAPKIDIPL